MKSAFFSKLKGAVKGWWLFPYKSARVCWCLSSCFFCRAFELVPRDWLGGGLVVLLSGC
ncbi:hypothetical protein V6Z11_D03G064500 [Gossypium hirsutum]